MAPSHVSLAAALLLVGTATGSLIPGRYTALWGAPWPTECAVPPQSLPDFAGFRISTNPGDVFRGPVVNCIYDFGLLPYYKGMGPGGNCADGDWNCTKATAMYGGIPQLTNLTAHLLQLKADLEEQLPDPHWSGVASIDWEFWKPTYRANTYNEYWIFINRSEALVQSQHPDWGPEQVAVEAEKQFDVAAQAFWTESINLAKKLRPNGVWGWYNFPGDCQEFDTELEWLYDSVTALFPSIYITTNDPAKNVALVDEFMAETRRLRGEIAARSGRVLPMYSFTWKDYDGLNNYGYLSAADVEAEFVRGALGWGLTGTIVWGGSLDVLNATRCGNGPASIGAYVNHTLGPALLRAANEADDCSKRRCSQHGTCWDGGGGEGKRCDCDAGWKGSDCSKKS